LVRHERGRSRIRNDGASGAALYYAATFTVAEPYTPYGLNGIVGAFANANGEFDVSSAVSQFS
jgi:hypothetical protein